MSTTYTTQQGDTWDLISYRVYGTETEINRLLEANFSIRNYAIFPTGIKVEVPDSPETKLAVNSKLPSWKQ